MTRLSLLFGCFLALAFLTVSYVFFRSEYDLKARHTVEAEALVLSVRVESRLAKRGERVVSVVAQCQVCHGADLSGKKMADDPWVGRLYAPNLTPGAGGIGEGYQVADWVRAIRFGIRRDGRSLLLMPSEYLSQMSDEDLASVIAYLRQLPPIVRDSPAIRPGWLTRLALSVGAAPELISASAVDRLKVPRRKIDIEATAKYGSYLVDLGSCRVCHRSDLRGGLHPLSLPDEPTPPDLTLNGVMVKWTRGDFSRAMREGRTPDGRLLDPEFMPWPSFQRLTELEISAIWAYLRRQPETALAEQMTGLSSR